MQFQCDLLRCEVHRPRCIETTALGAAYLAGLAVKYWDSIDDIKGNWAIERVFTPEMPEEIKTQKIKGWQKAVRCALAWSED